MYVQVGIDRAEYRAYLDIDTCMCAHTYVQFDARTHARTSQRTRRSQGYTFLHHAQHERPAAPFEPKAPLCAASSWTRAANRALRMNSPPGAIMRMPLMNDHFCLLKKNLRAHRRMPLYPPSVFATSAYGRTPRGIHPTEEERTCGGNSANVYHIARTFLAWPGERTLPPVVSSPQKTILAIFPAQANRRTSA